MYPQKVELMRCSRLSKAEEHDAGLTVTDTGKIEVFDLITDGAKNLVRRIGWHWKNDCTPHTVASTALGADFDATVAKLAGIGRVMEILLG